MLSPVSGAPAGCRKEDIKTLTPAPNSFACFNSLNPHKTLSSLQMGKLRHGAFPPTHTQLGTRPRGPMGPALPLLLP